MHTTTSPTSTTSTKYKGTVILFYKYINVPNPFTERDIQRDWWSKLNISGRMRLSKEGINANLYGHKTSIEQYKKLMQASDLWKDIDYKHSNPLDLENVETGEKMVQLDNDDSRSQKSDKSDRNLNQVIEKEDPFQGMRRIRVSDEITGTGPMKGFKPTALGGLGGKHLTPAEFNDLVKRSKTDDDVVVIDTRNHYETVVGKFSNAVDPKLRCFGQFPSWLEANKEALKDKHVGLYCTGGIRCEKASAYVKSLGVAKEVYQLKGGISTYLYEFSPNTGKDKGVYVDNPGQQPLPETIKAQMSPEDCTYEGVNFQFDNRFGDDTTGEGKKEKEVGSCIYCFKPTKKMFDEARCVVCTDFLLVCSDCLSKQPKTVSAIYKYNQILQNYDQIDPKLEAKLKELKICLDSAPTEQKNEEDSPTPADDLKEVVPLLHCPEHMLLGDNAENYLLKLMQHRWSNAQLLAARNSLQKLLDVADYKRNDGSKSHNRRRANLQLQIQKINNFLDKYPQYQTIENKQASKEDNFVPFVPFLNP